MNRTKLCPIVFSDLLRISCILLLLLGAGYGRAYAQQSNFDLPPPKEPLLPRVNDHSTWSVSLHYDREHARAELLDPKGSENKADAGAGEQPVAKIQVTKDGGVYREVAIGVNGKTKEKWIFDKFQAQESDDGKVVMIMQPAAFFSRDYSDYSRSDFEVLEWIDKSNFVGTAGFRGQPVYVFETSGNKRRLTAREQADIRSERATDSEIQRYSEKFVVYLDGKTQLPVYFDDGEIIRTYTYGPSNADKLQAPSKFQQALADWNAEVKQRTAKPLPP